MSINALYLPNWTVTAMETASGRYTLSATYDTAPASCPKCGVFGKLYKHGSKVIDYVDAPVHGRPTTVRVTVQRYRCQDCRATSMQPLPDMDDRRQMTARARQYIEEQGMVRTYASVARDMDIEETTVRSICNETVAAINAQVAPHAPVVLGIDELTLLGERRTIFVDVGERRVIDIVRDMTSKTVSLWLSRLPDKKRVRVVTIDMWDAYRKAAYGILPGVVVIADKWHVQKLLTTALDAVRARLRAETGQRKHGPHRARRLLHTSRHNLSPARRLLLDGVLKNSPLLNDAWHTKEAFYDIWEAPDRAEAERLFDEWRASIPATLKEFARAAKTVEDWRKEVFAFFDHRYTNAYTEAANGLIKIISRSGRGYRFEAIRARALAMPMRGNQRLAVCEECLGQFPAEPKLPTWSELTGSDLEQVIPKHAGSKRDICTRCSQLHIRDWLGDHGDPTLKTG